MNLNKYLSIILLLVLSFTFSCSTQNDDINDSELNLSNLEFNLKIKENFDITKKVPLELNKLEHFISKYFDEIKSMDEDLILLFSNSKNNLFYSIETKATLKKIKTNELNTNTFSRITCKKCTSKECVTKTLSDAIGEGTEEVFISVTPNYTLGFQTSISICYGTLPEIIENQD